MQNTHYRPYLTKAISLMSKLLALTLIWLTYLPVAMADYQYLVAGSISGISGKNYDSDSTSLVFSYYPEPVKTGQLPYAEGPFLQRKSQLLVRILDAEATQTFDYTSATYNSQSEAQHIEYTHARSDSDLVYTLSYDQSEHELIINKTIFGDKTNITNYQFSLGKYFSHYSMLEFSLELTDS